MNEEYCPSLLFYRAAPNYSSVCVCVGGRIVQRLQMKEKFTSNTKENIAKHCDVTGLGVSMPGEAR